MDVRIIKPKDVLTDDEALTISGGFNESYYDYSSDCSCDCFWGNKNRIKSNKPNSTTLTTQTTK